MKLKGQIAAIEPIENQPDSFVVHLKARGPDFSGGHERRIFLDVQIKAARATLRDYTLGDFYEISVEKVPEPT